MFCAFNVLFSVILPSRIVFSFEEGVVVVVVLPSTSILRHRLFKKPAAINDKQLFHNCVYCVSVYFML